MTTKGQVLSKHHIPKIIIVQLFRPFSGETLKNESRTKQSTKKLWGCEPTAKWVVEYQAGNEAERQAGDFWDREPWALVATYHSVTATTYPAWRDLKDDLAMVTFKRL